MARIRKARAPPTKPYDRQALDHQEADQVVNDAVTPAAAATAAARELKRIKAKDKKRKSDEDRQRFSKLYEFDNTRKSLGPGSQGFVSLCTVKETEEPVACKVVISDNLQEARQEVAIHRKCSSHPLVVTFLDAMEFDKRMYIVMEYCAGGTLKNLIDDYYGQTHGGTSSMPHELAAHVMKQLAQAMAHIHSKGIVHQDIKDVNVMMMSDRRSIRVVDFGVAKEINPDPQGATPIKWDGAGTSAFMAPEAVRMEDAGRAVDVWSAGVLLFRMLTGKKPFRNVRTYELAERDCLKEVDFSNRNLTEQAKDLLRRMLDFNPETRIRAPEIQDHPWIIESLATAMPMQVAAPVCK